MALKTLLFGTDSLFNALMPYYAREVQRGNLEITNYAVLKNETVAIFDMAGDFGGVNNFLTLTLQ